MAFGDSNVAGAQDFVFTLSDFMRTQTINHSSFPCFKPTHNRNQDTCIMMYILGDNICINPYRAKKTELTIFIILFMYIRGGQNHGEINC